ncbi:hypothetical protein [Amycolatopsis sp. YIM 10]|uniref:hypothetical protein n=1 Tax=Amycolatopsis sp. YIM 10 TaxID=2653857 RepID=UPI0012902125|nr:hypothetical protein [Amycolatopsis sp. YIM 10]
MLDPRSRPVPQPAPLLRALHEHRVDWVLSGSAVLLLHGADLRPNDLDVVPSLEPANLRRLADLLLRWEAVPAHVPSWPGSMSVDQCRAWTPEPPTAERLDHLYVTRLGMVDVPSSLTGTYAELTRTASLVQLAGVPVQVCAPEAVLDRLPARPRQKDLDRAAQYAAARRALNRDRTPRAVPWFSEVRGGAPADLE